MKAEVRFDFSEIEKMNSDFLRAVPQATQAGFNQAAELTRGEMVKAIQRGPATGRVYKKTNPIREHQASAPGEAPMSDTGDLARHATIDTKPPASVKRINDAEAKAGFPTGFDYADYLEYGTSKMAARPYVFPAFLKVQPHVMKLIRAAAKRALR